MTARQHDRDEMSVQDRCDCVPAQRLVTEQGAGAADGTQSAPVSRPLYSPAFLAREADAREPTIWCERRHHWRYRLCGACRPSDICWILAAQADEAERLYLATEAADLAPVTEADRRAAREDNWFARNHDTDKAFAMRNSGQRERE